MENCDIEKITRLVLESLKKDDGSTGFMVPVGVSARHIHLTQADVETLYQKERPYGRTVRFQRACHHSRA